MSAIHELGALVGRERAATPITRSASLIGHFERAMDRERMRELIPHRSEPRRFAGYELERLVRESKTGVI